MIFFYESGQQLQQLQCKFGFFCDYSDIQAKDYQLQLDQTLSGAQRSAATTSGSGGGGGGGESPFGTSGSASGSTGSGGGGGGLGKAKSSAKVSYECNSHHC